MQATYVLFWKYRNVLRVAQLSFIRLSNATETGKRLGVPFVVIHF